MNVLRFRHIAILLTVLAAVLVPQARVSSSMNYVIEVTLPSEEALQALLAQPFDVADVQEGRVILHVDQLAYARVGKMGYPIQVLEIQPDPYFNEKAAGYIAYDELGPLLAGYAEAYPHLCRVRSLGQSVNGRELWAIMITDDPDVPADRPAVKYISTIHGDEPLGTELCLYFAEELLSGYATDAYIRDLLGRTIIWIVPLMNPDGYVLGMRANVNWWDLNRSFPIYPTEYSGTWYETDVLGDIGRQPETAHVMRWNAEVHAALSANFHTGALVVNYPYDNEPGIPSRAEAPSPDDDVFRYISLEYSRNNPPMYASVAFPQGIVNGSYWYSITGGMMDWHYRFLGVPEVTLEVSVTKRPIPSLLPQLWLDNRNAMYAYVETAHIGIRGLVTDRNTGDALWAKVLVADREQPVFSNPEVGNYHRLLLPGEYDISVEAHGYIRYYVDGVEVAEGPAARVDVPLSDGDINGDGIVDATDIQLTVDAVLGRPVLFDADVDGRGLAATDIQAVINQSLAIPL